MTKSIFSNTSKHEAVKKKDLTTFLTPETAYSNRGEALEELLYAVTHLLLKAGAEMASPLIY